MQRHRNLRGKSPAGFTLVEILIVVIILGILAAIVIPQFTNASQDARRSSLTAQLQTLRNQIELYRLQHNDALPSNLTTDASTDWTQLTGATDISGSTSGTGYGPYLQAAPVNSLNGFTGVHVITSDANFGDTVGTASCGWVFNTSDGKIWATSTTGGYVFNEVDLTTATNSQ